ncbi:MAG: DUF4340 domain-containing protein [Clostridia bacterium]|nr:DUF4340 domain-containing protein [Clostridia bacterium]
MKKKAPVWRNAVIIGVVLAALVGMLFWVNTLEPQKEETQTSTETPKFTAYKIDSENVSSFIIKSKGLEIMAKNLGDGKWSLNDVSPDELDSSKVSDLVTTVTTMISNYEIAKDSFVLSEYGLENPYITIDIANKDGSSDRLLIGDKSPTTGEYFFLKQGDSTVYSIYAYKVDTMLKHVSYYQSYNRFKVQTSDINEIILKRKNKPTIHLKLKDTTEQTSYNVWQMLEPYEGVQNAIDQFVDDKILTPIGEMTVSDPAPAGRKYGFEDPHSVLTLNVIPHNEDGSTGEPYTVVLTVGNTENGLTYVKLDDKVYTVSESSLDFMNTDEFLVVSKLQALSDIAVTEQVKVSYSEKQSVLDITHVDENTFSFKINGKDADEKLSKEMYQNIIALNVDGLYKNEALGLPEVTIFYKGYGTGEDTTVEFIPINELSYALRRNGKTQFTIKKSKVEEMLQKLENFEANPTK